MPDSQSPPPQRAASPTWIARLDALDALVYRSEQRLAGLLFVAMVLGMAVSVAHRVFSRPEGRLSTLLLKLLLKMGMAVEPAQIHGPVSLGLNLFIGYLLAVTALRTAVATKSWSLKKSLAVGVLATALGAGAVGLLLVALPNGIVAGPALALAGMLWIGFLGASLTTYEKKHLALEMADKLWPQSLQRPIRGLAMLLTAALSALLCVLAWWSIGEHYATWALDPQAGQLLPTEIPKWTLLTVLPVSWTIIALRFAGEGIRILLKLEAIPPSEDLV